VIRFPITDVALALTVMAAIEAVVKPALIAIAQAGFPRATAAAMELADQLIPQLLDEGVDGHELETRLRKGMADLTGDTGWGRRDLSFVWRQFDPRILLTHNAEQS
jgi:hypothetical protein